MLFEKHTYMYVCTCMYVSFIYCILLTAPVQWRPATIESVIYSTYYGTYISFSLYNFHWLLLIYILFYWIISFVCTYVLLSTLSALSQVRCWRLNSCARNLLLTNWASERDASFHMHIQLLQRGLPLRLLIPLCSDSSGFNDATPKYPFRFWGRRLATKVAWILYYFLHMN